MEKPPVKVFEPNQVVITDKLKQSDQSGDQDSLASSDFGKLLDFFTNPPKYQSKESFSQSLFVKRFLDIGFTSVDKVIFVINGSSGEGVRLGLPNGEYAYLTVGHVLRLDFNELATLPPGIHPIPIPNNSKVIIADGSKSATSQNLLDKPSFEPSPTQPIIVNPSQKYYAWVSINQGYAPEPSIVATLEGTLLASQILSKLNLLTNYETRIALIGKDPRNGRERLNSLQVWTQRTSLQTTLGYGLLPTDRGYYNRSVFPVDYFPSGSANAINTKNPGNIIGHFTGPLKYEGESNSGQIQSGISVPGMSGAVGFTQIKDKKDNSYDVLAVNQGSIILDSESAKNFLTFYGDLLQLPFTNYPYPVPVADYMRLLHPLYQRLKLKHPDMSHKDLLQEVLKFLQQNNMGVDTMQPYTKDWLRELGSSVTKNLSRT